MHATTSRAAVWGRIATFALSRGRPVRRSDARPAPVAASTPRADLNAADYYPLASGWKWAYDVEKDGMNILATYAVLERTGDTAVVQAGDERLTYAVTPDGHRAEGGGGIGRLRHQEPGDAWAPNGRSRAARAKIVSVEQDMSSSSPAGTSSAASSSR